MTYRPILRRALLAAVLLLAGFAPDAHAREATITLKDGTKMTGDVIAEDAGVITLNIAGIRTPVARERIQDVSYLLSVAEQYRDRRARIADENQEERNKLIRWLIDNKAWDLAVPEVKDYQKKFPDDDRGRIFERIIDERRKIGDAGDDKAPKPAKSDADSAAKPDKPEKPEKPEKPAAGSKSAKLDGLDLLNRRLTDDQINLIRVWEINPDSKPPVIIQRDTIEDFLKNYAENDAVPKGRERQDAFRSAAGWEQLKIFFAARAREYYPKIKVKGDPEGIKLFRERIQASYLLNYCGTNECHGGFNAGEFFVFNRDPANVDPTVYSNFYILHRYEDSRGFMLDFERPERSYFAQFGLPTASAKTPHPAVKNYRPTFTGLNDPRYQTILKWIESFPKARSTYGIDWKPPVGKKSEPAAAATAPATQP